MGKITTVVLLALAVMRYVQAAEPTVITLSCDGTVRDSRASVGKGKSIKNMGLVTNLSERTAANISFSGETTTQLGETAGIKVTVVGDIDRVTGAMTATTESPIWTDTYDLLCQPARPSF